MPPRVRPHSRNVDALRHAVDELSKQCRLADIAVVYPPEIENKPHETRPLLGHTRGNTRSNRKYTKNAQLELFGRMLLYLESLLSDQGIVPCTRNASRIRNESSPQDTAAADDDEGLGVYDEDGDPDAGFELLP